MKLSDIPGLIKNRAQRKNLYCTAEYWDSKAEHFDAAAVSMWPNNHLNAHYHRETISWLDSHLGDVRGKRVLDAGCGVGRLARYYADRGAHVTGFDFSARSIELARKANEGRDNPTFRVQSVFELSDHAAYDAVIVWGVLMIACRTRAELLDALRRLKASLVPGGKLLLMEPIHSGFLHRVLQMGVPEVTATMREAGFQVHEITHMHFWPARLALAYVELPKALTAAGYHAGQFLLRLLGRAAMGDYKAIFASPVPAIER